MPRLNMTLSGYSNGLLARALVGVKEFRDSVERVCVGLEKHSPKLIKVLITCYFFKLEARFGRSVCDECEFSS